MMSDETHDIKKEVRRYYLIFGALLVGTVLTVAVSGLKVGIAVGVAIALVIATVKASLVASFFMHLRSEKPLIYGLLIVTVLFFLFMMAVILLAPSSVPEGTIYVS